MKKNKNIPKFLHKFAKYFMKFILLLSILILGFAACNEPEQLVTKRGIYGNELRALFLNALNGVQADNDTLSKPIDYTLPLGVYNNFILDSIYITNTKFFYVVAEFGNPVYNRLAVYDTLLNLHLIDKSLNGNITVKPFLLDSAAFLKVEEHFISKDVFETIRVSFYRFLKDSVKLVYRDYVYFKTNRFTVTQEITSFDNDTIKTKLTSPASIKFPANEDIFVYDRSSDSYINENNIFSNYVIQFINNIKTVSQKPEISDLKSALESVGIYKDADTIKSTSNYVNKRLCFGLTLPPEGWRTNDNRVVTKYIKQHKSGMILSNNSLGTFFYIVKLDPNEDAQDLIELPFTETLEGRYSIRFTQKKEVQKKYISYFEYVFGPNKFLLIIEAPVLSYEANKQVYSKIITSFEIGC